MIYFYIFYSLNMQVAADTKSLLNDLDTLYNYYLSIKNDHMQMINGQSIDSILITTYTSLHEVPLVQLNKVYVKQSNIEGLGVFAKNDIQCGEIVTIYPSDIVRLPNGNNLYYEFTSDRNVTFHEKYAYKTEYAIIAGDNTCIDDMNLVGHIVNDGCCTDGTQKSNNEYHTNNNNCIYYPYHMFILIVAYKNISKDEELLVSYGLDYWKIINT